MRTRLTAPVPPTGSTAKSPPGLARALYNVGMQLPQKTAVSASASPITVEQRPAGTRRPQSFQILPILSAFTVLLFCTIAFAQDPTPQVTQPTASPNQTAQGVLQDWEREQEFRTHIQNKFIREHSDPNGRVRLDLWIEGVAHMNRMNVARQIGPVSTESPAKK